MKPLLKYHGGKYYLKDFIISNFPAGYENMVYVEPFLGGGSILLNKKKSDIEIVSDIYTPLYYTWTIVQVKVELEYLKQKLSSIEYNKSNFESALRILNSGNYTSETFYVVNRMSRGGMGKNFAYSERLRGGIPGDINAWNNSIKNLDAIHDRIRDCEILYASYQEAISLGVTKSSSNKKEMFAYLDPPYLPSTRTSKKVYRHEWSEDDHKRFLKFVNWIGISGENKILISGYMSDLYRKELHHWNVVEKNIVNHSSQAKKKSMRTEVLWRNY